ncbi:MAG: hypothetical protein HYV61_10810 [Candidatus Rokubacteria bacterium]|nr:hypothetical protein [Candidatus Rokubacteria bacterium]
MGIAGREPQQVTALIAGKVRDSPTVYERAVADLAQHHPEKRRQLVEHPAVVLGQGPSPPRILHEGRLRPAQEAFDHEDEEALVLLEDADLPGAEAQLGLEERGREVDQALAEPRARVRHDEAFRNLPRGPRGWPPQTGRAYLEIGVPPQSKCPKPLGCWKNAICWLGLTSSWQRTHRRAVSSQASRQFRQTPNPRSCGESFISPLGAACPHA